MSLLPKQLPTVSTTRWRLPCLMVRGEISLDDSETGRWRTWLTTPVPRLITWVSNSSGHAIAIIICKIKANSTLHSYLICQLSPKTQATITWRGKKEKKKKKASSNDQVDQFKEVCCAVLIFYIDSSIQRNSLIYYIKQTYNVGTVI